MNEWLDRDPFLGYQLKVRTAERGFLSNEEMQSLHEKEFGIERLNLVRDLFLFSCYTGLSYIDVFNLTKDNISIGINGKKWIFTHRQKTDNPSRIPLLPPALEILQKYSNNPAALNSSKLLPIASNQKVNSYLKEIADCCGIKKKLTFHMARHTFATTITLNNNVPIESVSKMMGHTKIQTTQIYAKVLDEKISRDMEPLWEKWQLKDEHLKKNVS
jgi:site-specific recombinase XerD